MELVRFPSRGGFSVRSIFTFALAVIITALLWAIFAAPATHAADNATWNAGDVLLFDGHGFNKAADVNDPTGTIPAGAAVYKSPVQTVPGSDSKKLFVLYFAPGVDPPTAKAAKYVEFDYDNGKLSNPQKAQDLTVTPKGSDDTLGGKVNSSCSVGGIGWIICPVSTFLAESMDNLFGLLADLIKAQPPIIGDTTNGMYVAWNAARVIANVAFVIAFLIIIFSQLTSLGISNYGLKKLTPRLIVAAVLVNISFYIAAAAIDISNIAGYSVQQIFHTIREQVFQLNNDNFAGVNNSPWTAVTAVVLGGGGTIGGIYYLSSVGPYFLVTLLLGLGLTLLFVLILLAARQAIIVLLVIVSPLAFVANLLPNTEKWFDKWRDLFMTMLIFFPAFALVFGGSQLAGQVIIQNAGDNLITVIFGMAVQVAPLVITPLLLKLSGGLLGKIAQIANNPQKGVMDRARNWRGEREELHRQKALQKDTKGIKSIRPAAAVQLVENRRRRRKELTDMYKLRAENKWNDGKSHGRIHNQMHEAEMDKKLVHAKLEEHSQKHVLTNKDLLAKDMRIRVIEDRTVDLKGRLDSTYDELKSGTSTVSSRYGAQFAALETEAAEVSRNVALNAMRQQSAKRAQSQQLYQDLKDNTQTFEGQLLRDYAGGAQGHIGAQRALAQAISEQHKAHQEVVAHANAILDDYNLNAADNLKIAQNTSVRGIAVTDDIREAAIKRVAANGVMPHIDELLTSVDFSPTGNENFRLALVEGLKGNSGRPKYIGFGLMDKLTQGIPGGINQGEVDSWVESMLLDGKLSAKELATQDKDTLARITDAIGRLNVKSRPNALDTVKYFKATSDLRQEIAAVRDDKELWNIAGERKPFIDDLESKI